MKKYSLLAIFILGCTPVILAQGSNDYNKWDIYGGYSHSRATSNTQAQNVVIAGDGTLNITDMCSSAFTNDLGPNLQSGFFCSRRGFNGFDAAVTYNVTRYLGIKGDLSGAYKKDQFVDTGGGATTTVNTRERLHNFLGGVQIKDNSVKARLKPFGHALFGAARYSAVLEQTVQPFTAFNFRLRDNVTSFAMKLGGGLDVRAGRRIDVRVVEFDYNPVFARDRALITDSGPFTVSATGKTTHNFTIGVGIVIH